MMNWMIDKDEIVTKTINAIMGEFDALIGSTCDSASANYWLDSKHNVYGYIYNDQPDGVAWFDLHYELYDDNEDMVGDLMVANTEDTSRDSLLKEVKAIVNMYYGI